MDHQPLQDSAGRHSEEVRRSGRRSTDPSMRGPPSATDNLRRISTDRENRNLTISDHDLGDENFSFQATRSYSWESQSDGEDRGGGGVSSGRGSAGGAAARRDQRKFDMTTPTLIDEIDDEEAEMISLQRARMRQEERGVVIRDESSLRRTPGASMYKSSFPIEEQMQMHAASLRRTPGAHDMQQLHQEQADESAVLGFGLTLSTPVATGNRPTTTNTMSDQGETWESVSSSSPARPASLNQSTAEAVASMAQPSRPPRVPGTGAQQQQQQQQQPPPPNQQRGQFTFTPWTLPKGAQFESRHGACSPNTMRLTEDLGNLLFEEDDSLGQANQHGFRRAATSDSGASDRDPQREQLSAESWTSSYIFNSEHVGDIPSRVPQGRGRRGKNNDRSSRRSRGHDRSSRTNEDHGYHVASFLPYAQQPKPVRSTQPASLGNPFMPGGGFTSAYSRSDSSSDQQQQHHHHQQQQQPPPPQPRFFNFGGAFAPPAKDSGVGFRPPASAPLTTEQTSGMRGNPFRQTTQQRSQHQHYQTTRTSPNVEGRGRPGGFQSQSFQPLPPMAGASRDSPFQNPFPSPTPNFATTTASPPPTYGYSGPVTYAPHPHIAGMQTSTPEYFPMAPPPAPQESRSNVSHFQPPPPGWPGAPSATQYVPAQQQQQQHGNWPTSTSWGSGEYGYGMHPGPTQGGVESRVAPSPAPALASSSWSERETEFTPQASPSRFTPAPAPQLEAPHHPVPVSASPAFSSGVPAQSRRDQQTAQQSRQKSSRKPQTRRGSKQSNKQDKGKKADSHGTSQAHPRKPTPVNTSSAGSSAGGKKKKHSRGRDSQTPEASGTASACSTPSNVPPPSTTQVPDEVGLASPPPAVEVEAEAKRAALIESPATRSAFKDFYRRFRSEERSSFQGAEDFAMQSLNDGSLPPKVHWRVYLELADLAKRSNRFADARRLYHHVCQLQPYASQGWLEYSKLEEECGRLGRGADILREGLAYCEYNENLLARAIKHEEKMGNISAARGLLAKLKRVGIEKVWRTVLEGSLLEARAGNVIIARKVLKYLMHHVPWYGPLYLEAYRLERDLGLTQEALRIVELGLKEIPRYGPLWFGAFRLCEEMDIRARDFHLPQTMAMIDRATTSISKELIWKVHLDAAQMLERAALEQRAVLENEPGEESDPSLVILTHCRNRFAMTILNCPPNLRWKVWLAAGRMEIAVGNTERARSLFLRAHKVVPEKGRATTLLECARLEEFTGDFELARAVLCRSRVDYGSDWKVWLESVLLEIRGGDHNRAIELAKSALEIHPGTGRLWAALVQLRFFEGGEEAQFGSLKQALNAVPKSGEVWCEGGRIHLNPFSRTFNLERARRHLFFATKFTPQYGDSFLESLRLELLEQWVLPIAKLIWDSSKSYVLSREGMEFESQLKSYLFDLFAWLLTVCHKESQDEAHSDVNVRHKESQDEAHPDVSSILGGMLDAEKATLIRELLAPSYQAATLDLADLELRCANADPNYGLLWFHCRHGPTDTARRILGRAKDKVMAEFGKFVPIYIAAIIRHSAVADMAILKKKELKGEEGATSEAVKEASSEGDTAWENLLDECLLAAPPLFDILKNTTSTEVDKSHEGGMVFLENTIAESTFATGLAELNKHQPLGALTLNKRRKALFGTDALFS